MPLAQSVHLLTTAHKCILVSTFAHSARGLRNDLPILIKRLELPVIGILLGTLQGGLFDEALAGVAPKRIAQVLEAGKMNAETPRQIRKFLAGEYGL